MGTSGASTGSGVATTAAAAAAGGSARVTLPSSGAPVTVLTSPLQVHSDFWRGAADRRGGAVHFDDDGVGRVSEASVVRAPHTTRARYFRLAL